MRCVFFLGTSSGGASVEFLADALAPMANETAEDLVKEIEAQRSLMIAVATGGPRIQSVNEEYQKRRERIGALLAPLQLPDPNPYSDLWAWYGKWSSGDLPSYQSRREFISNLYAPLIDRLTRGAQARGSVIFEEPTGWVKVDRTLGEIRKRLEEASTEEQFQAVGLLCREALISLAQTVYDPTRHEPADGVEPSPTDAKRMRVNPTKSHVSMRKPLLTSQTSSNTKERRFFGTRLSARKQRPLL